MKAISVPLVRVGNSRGIRLPAKLIARHKLDRGMTLEERGGEIVLRPKKAPKKLSWEETYKEMAASGEDCAGACSHNRWQSNQKLVRVDR